MTLWSLGCQPQQKSWKNQQNATYNLHLLASRLFTTSKDLENSTKCNLQIKPFGH